MKYAVVTSKTTGNTGLLAETVKKVIPEEDLIYWGLPDDRALEADMILVGFWTNMGTCDAAAGEFLGRIEGKEVFLFGSAGWAGSDYFREILMKSSACLGKGCTVAGTFMCQGRMPLSVRERYQKLPPEKGEAMIKNFDQALTHPDERDLERLGNTVKALI